METATSTDICSGRFQFTAKTRKPLYFLGNKPITYKLRNMLETTELKHTVQILLKRRFGRYSPFNTERQVNVMVL